MSTFDELIRQGYDVLCITISSRLSGTYSGATVATRELGKGRVEVWIPADSRGHVHAGQTGAPSHRRGQTLPEIMDELIRARDSISIAFSVSDLTRSQSGRLGSYGSRSAPSLTTSRSFCAPRDSGVRRMARGHADKMRRLKARAAGLAGDCRALHPTGGAAAKAMLNSLVQSHPGRIYCAGYWPVLTIHLLSVLSIAFRQA